MHTVALIVAGGSGTRFRPSQHEKQSKEQRQPSLPKQYQSLHGRPLLSHSLETLAMHLHIDHVQVVIRKDDVAAYDHAIQWTRHHPTITKKLRPPVYGGTTRQHSVYNGLKALASIKPAIDYVLIHDAARPFLSHHLIGRIIDALHTSRRHAVIPVLDIHDTIKHVEKGYVLTTLSRDTIKRVQTPQGFLFKAIYQAHEKEQRTPHEATASDDSVLAERQGIRVSIVQGDAHNRKITSQHDMPHPSSPTYSTPQDTSHDTHRDIMSMHDPSTEYIPDIRVGSGFDVHQLETGEKMILGGIEIPSPQGLKGHSDADVVLHALSDALYGALAEEDIGYHFPPSESQWRQADSAVFLNHAVQRTRERGYHITHCDITIICELPKITPIRTAMREKIASLLHVPVARVSVKATTSEKLGFCGRGEGIATQATVTLVKATANSP